MTQKKRPVRPWPRTFTHFPEDTTCPVCGTNDDGETVLMPIDGTQDANLCEAQPIHLACAVADHFNKDLGDHLSGYGMLYRRVPPPAERS